MRAAVFKALGQPLVVEALPDPVPGTAEVLIEVGRCGICGTDLHITEDPAFQARAGMVLGHEFAGTVIDTGADVGTVRRGDRVAVLPVRSCGRCEACLGGRPACCPQMEITGGGYGEYTVVHEAQCMRLPASLSMSDGALVEPLAVGLHGASLAPIAPGSRVLVIGAGPIGLAGIFWARRLGAVRIAATASSMRRAELALQLGATAFLPPSENLAGGIEAALGGPADVVIEAVGKPGLLARAVELVRPRGTVVLLGLCTAQDTYNPFLTMVKEVRIQPAMLYTRSEFEAAADAIEQSAAAARAMITGTVGLAEVPEAFEALRQRTTQCKVHIDPHHRTRDADP